VLGSGAADHNKAAVIRARSGLSYTLTLWAAEHCASFGVNRLGFRPKNKNGEARSLGGRPAVTQGCWLVGPLHNHGSSSSGGGNRSRFSAFGLVSGVNCVVYDTVEWSMAAASMERCCSDVPRCSGHRCKDPEDPKPAGVAGDGVRPGLGSNGGRHQRSR